MNYISKQKSRNSMEQQICKHNVHNYIKYMYILTVERLLSIHHQFHPMAIVCCPDYAKALP